MSDSHLLSPPSLFPQSNQTSWSAGVLQSSQQLHSSLYPMSASAAASMSTPSSVPFSSSSLLSNQDAHSYRSVTVTQQHTAAINQHDNAWMNDASNEQQQGFDSWGVTHKTGYTAAPASYYSAPQKELNIAPHMQTVVVATAAPSTSECLPPLPSFVEFSSFSVAHGSLSVCDMWNRLEEHLLSEGIIVGETKEKQYQLLCFAPTGGKSTEFIVRCYAGHFREADPSASPVSEPHYTVEFQRRVGCCMGFVEIFRSAIRSLSEVNGKVINIDSRISATDNPCQMLNASNCSQSQIQSQSTSMDSESDVAAQIEHVDLSDCDLTQLAIPSLAASRANTGIDDASAASINQPPAALTADDSLYDSLCDLIASDDGPTQLEGLNALSLCLDTTQPRACEALKQVANKLRSGRCERIKQAAARVILQAAAAPQSSASNVIQACLPAVLAQLAQCSAAVTSNGAPYPTAAPHCPLAGACATQTQKCLLRSCLQLAACPQFQGVLDQEGSAVAFSTLKRQLLRMTDSPDEEVRGLAKQTIRALSV